jgi:phenylpropionate dioxygenase-like ring-hydroxylating dioxygenase large terminal subunit
MSRQNQINILKRLLEYVDTRTTAMADAPWRNDVSVYTDEERAAEEQRVLFRRHPLVMGFASDWAVPGTFRTDDFAGVPILVVRGRDDKLRAFLNVCRHRGAKVAQGFGSARLFSCPYHAWTYDLAGKVTGIPDERCFPGVRPERSSLVELPLCEKYGLVWVIPTAATDGATTFDVDPWLAGLGPELGSFEFGSWAFYDKRLIPETMNWKLVVDTFNEGYHIGFLHRDSLRDLSTQETATAQGRAGGELGPDVEHHLGLFAVPEYAHAGPRGSCRTRASIPMRGTHGSCRDGPQPLRTQPTENR